jgi:hypothetical protein
VLKDRYLEDRFSTAWAELAHLSSRSSWSYSEVRLPKPTPSQIFSDGKPRSTGIDDGKLVRVRVSGQSLSLDPGRWTLGFAAADKTRARLAATSVTAVSPHLVEVSFVSPALKNSDPASLELTYAGKTAAGKDEPGTVALLRVEGKVGSEAKPLLRVLTEVLIAEADGHGAIVVDVQSPEAGKPGAISYVTVEGAGGVLADPSGAVLEKLAIASKGLKALALQHLVPGRALTLVAYDKDDKEIGRASTMVLSIERGNNHANGVRPPTR